MENISQVAQKTKMIPLYPAGTKKVVAVIPCLNTERTIAAVVTAAQKYVDQIIVVDDGSTDMTALMAESAGATVMQHGRNKGKGAAMKTAAENIEADVIIFIDGDGQHNPADIPRLLEPILQGKADFVIGSRFLSGCKSSSTPFVRKSTNILASIVISLVVSFLQPISKFFNDRPQSKIIQYKKDLSNINYIGSGLNNCRLLNGKIKWITDCTSGFTALKMENWHKLNLISDRYQIETEMIYEQVKNGFIIAETPIDCKWKGSLSGLSVVKDGTTTILLLAKKLLNRSPNRLKEQVPSSDLVDRDEYYRRSL